MYALLGRGGADGGSGMKRFMKYVTAFFLAAVVATLDQTSKHAILESIHSVEETRAITPFFNLVLVHNHGISFGMFKGLNLDYQPYIFIAVAAVITVILLIWLFRTKSRLISVAIGFLIGGAIGNSLDRFFHGAVIDFLDFYAFDLHWPAFNLADSAIVFGVGLLFMHSLAFDKNSHQK